MRSYPRHAQSSSLHDLPKWVVPKVGSRRALVSARGEPRVEYVSARGEPRVESAVIGPARRLAPSFRAPRPKPVCVGPRQSTFAQTPSDSVDCPKASYLPRLRSPGKPGHPKGCVRTTRQPRMDRRTTCLHVNGLGVVGPPLAQTCGAQARHRSRPVQAPSTASCPVSTPRWQCRSRRPKAKVLSVAPDVQQPESRSRRARHSSPPVPATKASTEVDARYGELTSRPRHVHSPTSAARRHGRRSKPAPRSTLARFPFCWHTSTP